jgi:hypothetical protein
MYPNERSLVQRMHGRPFAFLGINSDSKDRLRQVIEKEKMTWHSWWDGGNTSGPIARKWNVRAWPTVYILDKNGIIRFKNVRDKALDEAVETLLDEIGKTKPVPN